MSDQVPALLRRFSEVDFADYRQALVERKLEVDKKLRQETARYWRETTLQQRGSAAGSDLTSGPRRHRHEMTPLQQYDFDRNERDAEAVRALTQPQLAAFWDATLSRASGAQQQAPFRACEEVCEERRPRHAP